MISVVSQYTLTQWYWSSFFPGSLLSCCKCSSEHLFWLSCFSRKLLTTINLDRQSYFSTVMTIPYAQLMTDWLSLRWFFASLSAQKSPLTIYSTWHRSTNEPPQSMDKTWKSSWLSKYCWFWSFHGLRQFSCFIYSDTLLVTALRSRIALSNWKCHRLSKLSQMRSFSN